MRIGGTDFDRQLSLGVVMPLFGFGSAMKRPGLDVPSSYFHDLATWSNINRMYEPRVIADIRQVRQEASEPELLDRLLRVVDEQRGHTLAMEVEDAKIALSETRQADIPLQWVEPGLAAAIGRPDLVSHTRQLAERIAARIGICLPQARLSADDIDAVFLTGGSVRLAHVRKAITQALPSDSSRSMICANAQPSPSSAKSTSLSASSRALRLPVTGSVSLQHDPDLIADDLLERGRPYGLPDWPISLGGTFEIGTRHQAD